MDVKTLDRIYRYDNMDLPVPEHLKNNPAGLRAFHATIRPAVATADVVESRVGDVLVTEYRRAVGTKG